MSLDSQVRSLRAMGYPEDYIERWQAEFREALRNPRMILSERISVEIELVSFPVHDDPGDPPVDWGMTQREAELHRIAENRRHVAERYARQLLGVIGVIASFNGLSRTRQRAVNPLQLIEDLDDALGVE